MRACLYTMYDVPVSVEGGQKKVSDPVEPQLQTVVNLFVGVGNQILVLCKNSKCS